jgi:hypothetical protein
VNFKAKINKDWTNFLANTVWLNKQVKIDKRTIFYPEWFNRGVKFVNDFVNDDGSFLTLDHFQEIISSQNIVVYSKLKPR